MKFIQILIFFLLIFKSPFLRANTPAVAQTCVACHGERGISVNDLWPNLAGQKETYLAQQLKAYRSGERFNELMSPIAKMLSDEEIQKLATYFSQLEITK